MFRSVKIFEVYTHPSRDAEDATVLVRQGASAWAFLFHMFWLAYHKLWLETAVFFALYVATILLGQSYGVSETVIGVLQLALQSLLALSAADIRAAALERKGYVLKDITTGASEIEAERFYYYTHAAQS
jgi:hypothetical protein